MEKNQNSNSYLKLFLNFCFNTTIHGFAFAPGKRNRKAWIFLLTVTACYCCFQCKLNLDSYLSYDVKIKKSLMNPENFSFPSITFCPQYVFRRSIFVSLPFYSTSIAAFYGQTPEERKQLTNEVCLQQVVMFNHLLYILYVSDLNELSLIRKHFYIVCFFKDQ